MSCKNITDEMVCRAIVESKKRYQDNREIIYPYALLRQETGEAEKVCLRAMERAHNKGYIEYGVSLRTGWLTDEGKRLIDIL